MSTTDVRLPSEEESRQLAEQARQKEWEGRGFLRELFLGTFQLDLIHPFPLRREDRPEFARFYDELKAFLREEVDSAAIDHTGEYPEHVIEGASDYDFAVGLHGCSLDVVADNVGIDRINR